MQSITTSTNAVVMRLLTDALDADSVVAKSYIAQANALLRGEHHRLDLAPTQIPSRGRLAPWQIIKVTEYMEENLGGQVRIAALATICRLSASYFPVTFKYTFGETLHAYLIRKRVERAQELMLTTALFLGQIALACGFYDQAHFCRVFRRQIGVTPGRWRDQRARPAQERNEGPRIE